MNTNYKHVVFAGMAVVGLWCTVIPPASAQEKSHGSAVVYPVVYSRNSGSIGSRETAVKAVREVLQKSGHTLVSDTVAASTWNKLRIPMPSTDRASTMNEIVRFGKAVKAKYVVAPVFDFHSRSIWVGLGPKTISTATVDIVITDVAKGTVVYTKQDVTGRSDEKFDTVKAVADLFLTPLVTVVSGGPKTPQEQRAVQVAVGRALQEWVALK